MSHSLSVTAFSARRLRALRAILAAVVAAGVIGSLALVVAPTAAADTADSISVNFASSTGPVRGMAGGALYGLSDDGVPDYANVAGAAPRTITTKAPNGLQHPNGDPLDVAKEFFATGGKTIFVNIQDTYADWPYNGGNRPEDFSTYLTMVTNAVTAIKQADPSHFADYVFVPFNEPDGGNWYADYASLKNQFLSDWSATYNAIKAVDASAKIGGPGLANYSHQRLLDLLSYAKANNELPDVITWHELNRDSLVNYRHNYADYRLIETQLGIPAIPINITEWGDRSDLSVPGQMIQWLTMFEDTKVEGNTAYWTYAGNLNDNQAGVSGANGGWWMLNWYGDLTGNTVALTPPSPNTAQTVQGIAAMDSTKKVATVLLGGGSNAIKLQLNGLNSTTFGASVDIRVQRDDWSGYDGTETDPPVILAQRVALSGVAPTIAIPNTDRMAGYRVTITPSAGPAPAATAPWTSSIEAENTTLNDVTAYAQDTDANTQLYATSGKEDVGSTNKADSSLTWKVTVPTTGTYRLASFGGTNKAPGQHALFVDNTFNQLIQYSADLGWTYRGTASVLVSLTAGTHTLSVRMSKDGATVLPGADIALDKFVLTRVEGTESYSYPAHTARVLGPASYTFGTGSDGSELDISPTATAQYFLSAQDTGYYDLGISYAAPNGATPLSVTVNGRPLNGLGSPGTGPWQASARIHLGAGISELDITTTGRAELDTVTLTRAADADAATKTIQAENGTVAGTTKITTIAASTGSNVQGGADVTYLGDGVVNTLTIARPTGTPAGAYDLDVRYANADQNTASHYNTDVISRSMDITETGGTTTRAVFRHDFSWVSFWDKTVPLNLTTNTGDLVLGNATGWAPNVDAVSLSPFVLSTEVTSAQSTQTVAFGPHRRPQLRLR